MLLKKNVNLSLNYNKKLITSKKKIKELLNFLLYLMDSIMSRIIY
jgi:hypothetical protein